MLRRSFDIEKRAWSWLTLAGLVAVCLYGATVMILILMHPTPAQRAESPWYGVALVILFAGGGVAVLWEGIRSRLLELTETGLMVRDWSVTKVVPWSEIARVRGHNMTLVLYDRAGGKYALPWTVYRNPVDVKDFVKAHLDPSTRWDVDES